MRISELNLSGFKRIAKEKFGYPDEIIDFLLKNNYKLSGDGTFSQVYIKDGSNIAIKVSQENDTCWLKYVELIKKYPNKHFIKIGKINRHDKFYIAFMEKLYPIDDDENEGAGNVYDWFTVFINNDGFDSFGDDGYYSDPEIQNRIMKFEHGNPELAKAFRLIKNIIDPKCSFDVSTLRNNCMKRRDGTIVIIDPLYML